MPASDLVVGMDVGGTKILAGVVDRQGQVRSRSIVPSHDLKDRPAALLDRIAALARSVVQEAGLETGAVGAIGVCVPGPLDVTRSVVTVAPNLGWDRLPAREELERRLPSTPVFLENDVRAAALGEHVLGAGAGYSSMLAMFVGTGVGGGLILDGQLYHGARGSAGEIGHSVLSPRGPRCPCSRRGCLEAFAAREAVARYVEEQVRRGKSSVLTQMLGGDFSSLTSRDLALAIEQGDPVATRAATRSAYYAGLGLGGLLNVVDPAIVVLGGGIVEAFGERYVGTVARQARRRILSSAARDLPIVLSALGDDAGFLGAALLAFRGLALQNRADL